MHPTIKLRLDPEEFAPIARLANELHVTPEAVAYAGLNGIMRRAREAEAHKEIIAAHAGRHEGLPTWADDARSTSTKASRTNETAPVRPCRQPERVSKSRHTENPKSHDFGGPFVRLPRRLKRRVFVARFPGPTMAGPLRSFHDFTRDELSTLVASWNFSPVHATRLWSYVYNDGVRRWADMPEVPMRLRGQLETEISLTLPLVAAEAHSADGFTRKYLLALDDGSRIETVLMRFTGRVTACISSQAGCALGCVFCATGQMGFVRHLTPGEIVAQVLHLDGVLNRSGRAALLARTDGPSPHDRHERLRNVVLMGMGEPLHNYEAVMRAVDILRDQNGPAIGAKRITLSTVGVIPGIVRLADEARPIQLAVSLHAATQAERVALVPVAQRWPLDALMDACRYYVGKQQRRIFFEWTLIAGRNDTIEQAHAVGRLLRGLQAQVNLIPLNPTRGYDGAPTDHGAARRFQEILTGYGLPSTMRQRRGIDIAAGCGQLATAK